MTDLDGAMTTITLVIDHLRQGGLRHDLAAHLLTKGRSRSFPASPTTFRTSADPLLPGGELWYSCVEVGLDNVNRPSPVHGTVLYVGTH